LAVSVSASTGLILDVSTILGGELMKVFDTAMNPITAEGNMFANLFEKVPAKRAGIPEDIVATILYLVSKAGVCLLEYCSDVGICQWAIVMSRWRPSSRRKWPRIIPLCWTKGKIVSRSGELAS
jgi:hypothetical protein